MACQGRGGAYHAAALLLPFLAQIILSQATTVTVGGTSGWSFNVNSWAEGKTVKAGDILVFKYNPWFHNVVRVDENGYNNCNAPRGSETYRSGNDSIRLYKGFNYFICSIPFHCNVGGMKIAVCAL